MNRATERERPDRSEGLLRRALTHPAEEDAEPALPSRDSRQEKSPPESPGPHTQTLPALSSSPDLSLSSTPQAILSPARLFCCTFLASVLQTFPRAAHLPGPLLHAAGEMNC